MKYLLLIFLVSCATSKHDPEISQILTRFMLDYKESINIELGDKGNYYDRVEDKTFILAEKWGHLSKDFREMLIYHEMFHHILRRKHLNEGKLNDGCPYSIMYYKIDEPCWKRHKKWYIREGFSKRGEF